MPWQLLHRRGVCLLQIWLTCDAMCLVITHSDRHVTAAVTSSVLPPSNEVKLWMQSMYEAA